MIKKHTVVTILLAALLALVASNLEAASRDTIADRVLGQTSFNTTDPGSGLSNLYSPRGVAVDPMTGRIYVADAGNSRVLGWSSATAFTLGDPATIVITSDGAGIDLQQPSSDAVDRYGNLFVADSSNNRVLLYPAPVGSSTAATGIIGQTSVTGIPTADSLSTPYGVAVDAAGDLFVADTFNNRVLAFRAPLSTGMSAARVYGQPDFTSGTENQGKTAPGADTLYWPLGVAVDSAGTLYVADTNNSRVLAYVNALGGDSIADLVLGETSFTVNTGGSSATLLNHPMGLAADTCGGLYVSDSINNRVLKFPAPLASGKAASLVFGQPDFSQNVLSIPPTASSLNYPRGLALDRVQNVYIADLSNNRVLGYDAPSTSTCSLYLPLVRK